MYEERPAADSEGQGPVAVMAEPTNKERRLKLHMAICKCPKCKGTCDRPALCPSCKEVDGIIDSLKDTAVLEAVAK